MNKIEIRVESSLGEKFFYDIDVDRFLSDLEKVFKVRAATTTLNACIEAALNAQVGHTELSLQVYPRGKK